MPAKALIKIDLRIAELRDFVSQGKGDAGALAELAELLRRRGELIQEMLAKRDPAHAQANPSRRDELYF